MSDLPPDIQKFHDHLDVCRQCREHPFDLCPTGATLLRAAARLQTPNVIHDSIEMRLPDNDEDMDRIVAEVKQIFGKETLERMADIPLPDPGVPIFINADFGPMKEFATFASIMERLNKKTPSLFVQEYPARPEDLDVPETYEIIQDAGELRMAIYNRLPCFRDVSITLPELLKKVAIDMFIHGVAGDDRLAFNVRFRLKELYEKAFMDFLKKPKQERFRWQARETVGIGVADPARIARDAEGNTVLLPTSCEEE